MFQKKCSMISFATWANLQHVTSSLRMLKVGNAFFCYCDATWPAERQASRPIFAGPSPATNCGAAAAPPRLTRLVLTRRPRGHRQASPQGPPLAPRFRWRGQRCPRSTQRAAPALCSGVQAAFSRGELTRVCDATRVHSGRANARVRCDARSLGASKRACAMRRAYSRGEQTRVCDAMHVQSGRPNACVWCDARSVGASKRACV
jgi:hypothetical protein